jgi:tetratricopeptide (TPR) repeat protein
MYAHLHATAGWTARAAAAVTICLGMTACATASPSQSFGSAQRQSVAPAAASNIHPVDLTQRNRQFQKAEALYLSGHLKEAAAAFAELTRTYPNDARIWLKYGNTLTKQESYDEAAAAYLKATTLDAEQGNAPLNLALVHLLQAQQALAVALDRLPAQSAERAQADTLQRQVKTLLGGSESAAAPH